jgi:hypothetical protein
VTLLFRQLVDSTRSAQQVWRIRKAGLELFRQEVLLEKLQGYGELATGMAVALLDYNFFMPEALVASNSHPQRVQAFGEYWEDVQQYKLGDVDLPNGWQQPLPGDLK